MFHIFGKERGGHPRRKPDIERLEVEFVPLIEERDPGIVSEIMHYFEVLSRPTS